MKTAIRDMTAAAVVVHALEVIRQQLDTVALVDVRQQHKMIKWREEIRIERNRVLAIHDKLAEEVKAATVKEDFDL